MKKYLFDAFCLRFGSLSLCFAFLVLLGCNTTGNLMVEMTGDARPPTGASIVEVFQDPPGMVDDIRDSNTPSDFERIAKLEISGIARIGSREDIQKVASKMIKSLRRQAADLGANALVIRKVTLIETERETDAIPRTLNVRAFDKGQEEYDMQPPELIAQKVLEVTVLADSIFLDPASNY